MDTTTPPTPTGSPLAVLPGRLLPDAPVTSLEGYLERGGGLALKRALSMSAGDVIALVKAAGLRGRGGAGFPTGIKWAGLASDPSATKYLVCNAAEGEPATFKDRMLIRRNPYQLIEGIAIAAHVTGAAGVFIGIKGRFEQERAALGRALEEMTPAGLAGAVPIDIRLGPDEYLFGEERALLEVIEGREPMPRVLPPYMDGILSSPNNHYPTAVNNVETLSNVPGIIRGGPDWFREVGTERSPGTMVFTLVGDVARPGIYELPLGTTLGALVEEYGGGPLPGRQIKAVLPGASHPVLTPAHYDTPLDFDAVAEIGSGLGTGFAAYDDSACMVQVAHLYSRFLSIESCGQCNACKLGSARITDRLAALQSGEGTEGDLAEILERCRKVTDGQRCYLPSAESFLVQSMVGVFVGEFAAHLESACPFPREVVLPKILDFEERSGTYVFDERYARKRPDWTYEEEPQA